MVKIPIIIACMGYILGIICGLYLEISMASIFAICIIIIFFNRNKNRRRFFKIIFPKRAIIIFVVFVFIGATYICILNKKYEKLYEINEPIDIIGTIEKVELKEYTNKYIIKVNSINDKKCINIRLILHANKENILEYGDYIKLKVEYSKPEERRNYQGFSYENYLKQNGIYGIVKPIGKIDVIKKNQINYVSQLIDKIRNKIIIETDSNLSEESRGVFLSILLGEKSQITDEINMYFKQGNMAHILAISGAHVNYIIITFMILFNKLGKRINFVITILALGFFMILTNFSPSVVRACVLGVVSILAKLIHRKDNIYNNLAISALLILIYNPYLIFNIGFELTYLGTIGIIVISKRLVQDKKYKENKIHWKDKIKNKIKQFILNSIIISISVQIFIFPVILINFNTISYNFLIAGIIAIPIFSMLMIIGILFLIFVPIRQILFPIINILINYLIGISKFLSKLPFSNIIIPTPNIVWIIGYYLGIVIILIFKSNLFFRITKSRAKSNNILKKVIALLLIICLIVQLFNIANSKYLRIYFIDVGQGDASLIITPKNKVILLDGGGNENNNYNVGETCLVPYLLDRGVSTIDYMIFSHFDNDHSQGLIYAMEKLKVKNIIIGKQFEYSENYINFFKIVKKKNIKVYTVEAGQRINIEQNLYFDILWPSSKNIVRENNLNNNSLVCKLQYGEFSMLFTGDIEAVAEKEIIKGYKNNVNKLVATVLKVAHHGSKTSSSNEFLEAVKPKIALIGVGKDNKFGHPSNSTLKNLENMKCQIYRTDKMGEITIKVDKNCNIKISKQLN